MESINGEKKKDFTLYYELSGYLVQQFPLELKL